jgi:hypothetical protein
LARWLKYDSDKEFRGQQPHIPDAGAEYLALNNHTFQMPVLSI